MLSDVESALSNGPPYALLEFDAALAYAFAAQQEPGLKQKAITHLHAAAGRGFPVAELRSNNLLDPLINEAGLVDTVTKSAVAINPADAAAELFAPKADLARINACLGSRTPKRLFMIRGNSCSQATPGNTLHGRLCRPRTRSEPRGQCVVPLKK